MFHFQNKNSIKIHTFFYCRTIFMLLLILASSTVSSQSFSEKKDSLINIITQGNAVVPKSIEKTAKSEQKESQKTYISNQIIQKQNHLFNLIDLEVKNANSVLKKGIDYKKTIKDIQELIEWEKFATKGIIGEKLTILTDRNLSATSILLEELLIRANNRLTNINIENQKLSGIQKKLDSLVSDKNLYYVPTDSVSRKIYHQQSLLMNMGIDQTSRKLKNAIDSIQSLEIKGDKLKYNIESDIFENESLRKEEIENLLTKKVPIYKVNENEQVLIGNPLLYSLKTNQLLLYFYVVNHINLIIMILFLMIGTSVFLNILRSKFLSKVKDMHKSMTMDNYILKSPNASAILIIITLSQLILPLPPLVFSILIWTISAIALTIMLQKTIAPNAWKIWIGIFILNLMTLFDNIMLVHTIWETFLILAINCFGITIGLYAFIIRKQILRKFYFWYIGFAAILQIVSTYYLLNGYYNFSKIVTCMSVYAILIPFLIYNTFLSIKEIKSLSNYLNDHINEESVAVYSNSHETSTRFHAFVLVVCFLLLGRNTYSFQQFVQPIKTAISEPIELGNAEFSLESIIVFIFVIFLSGFLSKLISFLADESRIISNNSNKKAIGSWMFLTRIAIMTTGFIIAFTMAGFPLDKITLIISALGVGIGFGMQSLVNNLISGLIIAFEKPVNLDDIIEIGNQSGKMKSIGIRSSVVTTFDGADVIIPNGELLNQNLTNWTLGSSRRRSEIAVGVAYGTDLELTKELLSQIMNQNKRILKRPMPVIWFTKFNQSAIDVVIKYWISHFDLENDIRSEMIMAIDKTFKENNIVIPFPQQDIHIKKEEKNSN
jgi:potassium efflux system protein